MNEEERQKEAQPPKRRDAALMAVVVFLSGLISLSLFLALPLVFLFFHAASPLPSQWRPNADLRIAAPLTPVTRIQLRRALADGEMCRRALQSHGIGFTALEPLEESENCHIRERLSLFRIGEVSLDPVETSCATALRLAMWVEHGMDGLGVNRLHHLGSYNCRRMRTSGGQDNAWSHHATAGAIDITGVTLDDGRRLTLLNDWNSADGSTTLRHMLRTACSLFPLVLGPDYNALHADHFHLQTRGWGYCR